MEIDGDAWGRRFGIGLVSLLLLFILLLILGTEEGRVMLLFSIIIVSLIFGMGYAVDILHQGYKEYTT